MPTLASGQVIPELPTLPKLNPIMHVSGSALTDAANKTIGKAEQEAAAAHELGAGQSGGKRRKKKRGGNLNVAPLPIPTAGSIDGVTPIDVQVDMGSNLLKLQADAAGDGLSKAPAYEAKSGGKRTRRKLNGRHYRRTRRRRNNKSSTHRRRIRRSVLKSLGKI